MILQVRNLDVYYGNVHVVRSVDFVVQRGETLALVGESGSGKTTTANAIMRILPATARIGQKSEIIYYGTDPNGVNILNMNERDFSRKIRWKEISMVFQSSLNALNPTIRVSAHFIETAYAHGVRDKQKVLDEARRILERVRLDPERVLRMYPIELSGGMKQRVVIALALFFRPKFVILDEPSTALDVVTQREIINLLKELKEFFNLTYMLITHDLALVAEMADRVAVMYAGEIVEEGPVEDIFLEPLHPYTQLLNRSIPRLGEQSKEPPSIVGETPDYRRLPPGCPFHTRCPYAMHICRQERPPMVEVDKRRRVRCFLYASKGERG